MFGGIMTERMLINDRMLLIGGVVNVDPYLESHSTF